MKRTFIAVPVPVEEPLRKLLGELQHTFREDRIIWIEPENSGPIVISTSFAVYINKME